MISLGVILVIVGVGSLVLDYLGLDIPIVDAIDTWQPWAGIIVAAVGLITVLFGAQRRGRLAVTPGHLEPPPASAAPGAPADQTASALAAPQTPSPMDEAPETSRPWPTEPPERRDDD